ncbi:MAG: polyribonucleotide nucleotidyltransferase [Cytophagales bacterium]|jgi:polyribonucleotide nucleotidyltransferase|nr:polyribonucleotide nucleotidyltransferase [Cytophagales bacterium]MCA6390651.1 polyribonucleotide nucleotidyltransferase [Cytophagales bacterium]MCA6396794.1 polyribonucleotide nucleotidyltransferase [Cytophagales bacterium]MCA6403313.1 polyribonucleotide nucleotidyltransferase [Cytophagales bacterium]MCA6407368.1 polyribonucleotide nucleotidyltransferase [Cytophagales bacterium]
MNSTIVTKSCKLPDGREITVETGKLARQADGAVVVRMGNTMLLATVVANQTHKEGTDFLPMSVDYQEKFAATGKIPGGFLKRESRLSDYEILISRLIDRAIRPLFPDDYHAETQIMIQLISGDPNALPDSLAAFAASAALSVSDIPFQGPISEVRVARVDGKYIINPTLEQKEKADLDFIVAASIENILMVEGECKEINEEDMLEALKLAHEAIKVQCELQIELTKATNKTVKRVYNHEVKDEAFKAELHSLLYDKVYAVARQQLTNKHQRSELFGKIVEEYVASLPEDTTVNKDLVKKYYKDIQKKACRDLVLNEKVRLDGRKTNEIRPIWSEVDYLPMAHGSAIFTRGETQSLSTVTLGTKLDEQMIDGAMFSGSNKFILHYNFPSFSTGEVKPNRGPGRREVGHGNLAMRALKQVLPNMTESPYTIRLVSDILESNGSSSMATVCAGSLALMDAGIKISGPVSGIAMGMISDSATKKYAILSDILGDEDHLGDMDFKVTGTEKGITACQMDLKVDGLTYEVLKEALDQAKEGRAHILSEMKKTLAASKPDLKPHTPRAVTIVIDKELIGAVIGPGGKVVQDIQKTTGATVVIEEVGNKGIVNIFANNQEVMDAAVRRVKAIVAVPEVGEVYNGIVKSIMPFGAFVEFMPGKDGLLHISEIKWERLETMDGVMQVGEEVKVKLVEVDKKTGKFRLSRKVLLAKPSAKEETPSA